MKRLFVVTALLVLGLVGVAPELGAIASVERGPAVLDPVWAPPSKGFDDMNAMP